MSAPLPRARPFESARPPLPAPSRETHARLLHSQRLELAGQLAAGVAHDFNNVLTAIGGFTAELIDGCGVDDHRLTDLRQIDALVRRASGLASNLLGLTRKREHDAERLVNVAEELHRLAPTLRILLGSRIELVLDSDEVPFSTAIDPGLLDQVVLNLAVNARDASPAGGRVTVGASMAGTSLRPLVLVRVRDAGSGMPADVLDRLFQPFFTTKDPGRGTGLGLWLVRGIVESAGGRIAVQSALDAGTVVSVELPAVDEPPSGEVRRASAALRDDARGRTILYVEDEPVVREVTRRILERAGFRVLEASSGDDGLRLLARQREEIDAIITDLRMPGLEGASLLTRLYDAAPEIGCLVLSGMAEMVDTRAAAPGDLAVLAKPYDSTELIRLAGRLARSTAERRARTAITA